jgi:hypothetical protein
MLRPEDSEASWKPEQILTQYESALDCAWRRGDSIAYEALYGAFVCAWNRSVARHYKGNRL